MKNIFVGFRKEDFYAIHEVYYDKEGNPNAWTTNPISLQGDSLEVLKLDFFLIAEAFNKPILDIEELEKELKRKSMEFL